MSESLLLFDPDSLVAVNWRLSQGVRGERRDESGAQIAQILKSWAVQPAFAEAVRQCRAGGLSKINLTIASLHDKPAAEVSVRLVAMAGASTHVLAVWDERATPDAAAVDPVTNLPDRRQLAHAWAALVESDESARAALLFLDLDDFKNVNDRYGHSAGDFVLRTLAGRWRTATRAQDALVRYGGDEFVILLAGVAGDEALRQVTDRINRVTRQPIAWRGQEIAVQASLGVAWATKHVALQDLLDEADERMYAAKKGGPRSET